MSCSLAVTHIRPGRNNRDNKVSLCSAYFQNAEGRILKPTVKFTNGGCNTFRLELNLAREFEMYAEADPALDRITIVLRDGSWESFTGAAIFPSIPIR